MAECLQERIDTICEALPAGVSFEEWLSDAPSGFEALHEYHLGNAVLLESVGNAYGYLEGAADMAEMTVLELLWEHECRLSKPRAKRERKATR